MKAKRIIGLLLTAAMLLPVAACNNDRTNDGTDGFVFEKLICGFESYDEMYDVHSSGTFRLDFNSDKQYVTEGNGSVFLSVDERDGASVTEAGFGVKLYSNDGEKNYRDFSHVTTVTFDVFNASADAVAINTSLMQKKIGYMYSNIQTQSVEAGQKATVSYTVNPYEIYYSLGIDEPTHFNVTVRGVDPKVYFDNMVLHYKEEGFTAPAVSIDGNKILDFEKSYHSFVTYTTGSLLKAEVRSDASVASEGSRYIRVYRNGMADGTVLYAGGKFGISAKYLSNYNFADPNKINSYIAFDYKATWSSSQKLWTVLRLVATSSGAYLNSRGTHLIADKNWHTIYVPFDKLPQMFDNLEVSFDGGSYGDILFDNFRVVDELPQSVIEMSEEERNISAVIQSWGTT